MALPLLLPMAVGAAGSLISGIAGGRQRKKAKDASLDALDEVQATANQRQAELDKWYNDIRYTPALQSDAAKAQVTKLMGYIRDRGDQTKAQAALTGGSDEAVVAQNTQDSKVVGDTVNNIAVQDEARKDAARSEYNQRQAGIDATLSNIALSRGNVLANFANQNAANWQNAGQNIGDAAMNFAWMDMFNGSKNPLTSAFSPTAP